MTPISIYNCLEVFSSSRSPRFICWFWRTLLVLLIDYNCLASRAILYGSFSGSNLLFCFSSVYTPDIISFYPVSNLKFLFYIYILNFNWSRRESWRRFLLLNISLLALSNSLLAKNISSFFFLSGDSFDLGIGGFMSFVRGDPFDS